MFQAVPLSLRTERLLNEKVECRKISQGRDLGFVYEGR